MLFCVAKQKNLKLIQKLNTVGDSRPNNGKQKIFYHDLSLQDLINDTLQRVSVNEVVLVTKGHVLLFGPYCYAVAATVSPSTVHPLDNLSVVLFRDESMIMRQL